MADKPFHHFSATFTVTTGAEVRTNLDYKDGAIANILTIREDGYDRVRGFGASVDLWLGDIPTPATVAPVCDRLIAALTEIRDWHRERYPEAVPA